MQSNLILFVMLCFLCSLCSGSDDDLMSGLVVYGEDDSVSSLPLRSMKIDGVVIDGVVEVTMTQEFETMEFSFEPLVTHYLLPIDEQGAVTAFRAEVGTRVIEGIVKEKEEAREEFEQAIEEGKNAYLGEQTRADIFSISVGNLPAGLVARVTIVYVAPLEAIGSDMFQFVLPTAIAPRYEPPENSEGAIPSGEVLINKGVQISLDIIMSNELLNVTSATHQISVNQGTEKTSVSVVDEDPLRRDVVIAMKTQETQSPQVYVEESTSYSSFAMMVSFVPDIDSESATAVDSRYEFIFVVDRSGSMDEGSKMAQTRRALSYIISQSLPEDSYFNIIGFGDTFEPLFGEGSKPISNEDARGTALNYIDNMAADFGGTEILRPLESVLSSQPREGYGRIVFVLTDGQVSNTDDVIEYVQNNRASTRVFSLGIGAHVSRLLVQGIARAGGGTAAFVDGDSDQAIRDAVERQMDIALSPSLVDVQAKWTSLPSGSVLQAPFTPPPLVTGKRSLLFFLVEDETMSIPTALTLSGTVHGTETPVEFQVDLADFVQTSEAEVIHKMTARELIRDLEEARSELHDQEASDEEIEAEIIRLGVKYQISSSQTSFVAIDNEEWTDALFNAEDEPFDTAGSPPAGSPTYGAGSSSTSKTTHSFLVALASILWYLLSWF